MQCVKCSSKEALINYPIGSEKFRICQACRYKLIYYKISLNYETRDKLEISDWIIRKEINNKLKNWILNIES